MQYNSIKFIAAKPQNISLTMLHSLQKNVNANSQKMFVLFVCYPNICHVYFIYISKSYESIIKEEKSIPKMSYKKSTAVWQNLSLYSNEHTSSLVDNEPKK